jgi:hypothetical protein
MPMVAGNGVVVYFQSPKSWQFEMAYALRRVHFREGSWTIDMQIRNSGTMDRCKCSETIANTRSLFVTQSNYA